MKFQVWQPFVLNDNGTVDDTTAAQVYPITAISSNTPDGDWNGGPGFPALQPSGRGRRARSPVGWRTAGANHRGHDHRDVSDVRSLRRGWSTDEQSRTVSTARVLPEQARDQRSTGQAPTTKSGSAGSSANTRHTRLWPRRLPAHISDKRIRLQARPAAQVFLGCPTYDGDSARCDVPV